MDSQTVFPEVGDWAEQKHQYLKRYIGITRATRAKYRGPRRSGATYIDLFCGDSHAVKRGTDERIDGSALVAWKESLRWGTPFTKMCISDINEEKLRRTEAALKEAGASSVEAVNLSAIEASDHFARSLNPQGLHLAFIDPFGLGALDFQILINLSSLARVDLLMHFSVMDFQRNAQFYAREVAQGEATAFDRIAPGWRKVIDPKTRSTDQLEQDLIAYWRESLGKLGKWPASEHQLITGPNNAPLYWLVLASAHPLGERFWKAATNIEKQGDLGF